MRSLFLACTVALFGLSACSVDWSTPPGAFTTQFRTSTDSRRQTKKYCSDVDLSSLKWAGVEIVDVNTSNTARSYYENFNTTISRGHGISKFELAIEYQSPEIVAAGDRKVNINWNNLLFTSSLFVRSKSQRCPSYPKSYLGFVELVETDTTWYKNRSSGIEHRDWNLAERFTFQHVMVKPLQRAILLNPVDYGRIASLKYESYENITIDFMRYPGTLDYEKLVEKKIFLVESSESDRVLEVIAGVDVMMYLHYQKQSVTDRVHLKKHSLIQRIINAKKYASMLNDKGNQMSRDRKLTWTGHFRNPDTVTLNPLL